VFKLKNCELGRKPGCDEPAPCEEEEEEEDVVAAADRSI
jgi:hypothetical protein